MAAEKRWDAMVGLVSRALLSESSTIDIDKEIDMTNALDIGNPRECCRNAHLRTRMTGAVVAAALAWTCCTTAAPEAAAAGVTSLDDLPAVVARVNGKPVPKTAVAPEQGEAIAAAVRRAVDQELVAQQFVKEEFENDPAYRQLVKEQKQRNAMREQTETLLLATFYEKSIPELAKKPDPTQVTAAEVDAWMQGDTAILGSLTGEKAREAARRLVARQKAALARGEWLKAHLAKAGVRVHGESVPQSVIDEAVAAMAGRRIGSRQPPKTPIMDKIGELVIARAAKQRGVQPAAIAKDARLVKELLAGAVIEGAGDAFVLGDHPDFGGPYIWFPRILGQRILAAEAREKGVDRDPAFRAEFEKSRASRMGRAPVVDEAAVRAKLYYAGHGLDWVRISEDELDEWYLAMMRALMNHKQEEQNYFSDYLQAAKLRSMREGNPKITAAEISDAELDAWYLAMMRALVNKKWEGKGKGEEDTLHSYLRAAKLKWKREGYLEELRKTAKIEYLVDLD